MSLTLHHRRANHRSNHYLSQSSPAFLTIVGPQPCLEDRVPKLVWPMPKLPCCWCGQQWLEDKMLVWHWQSWCGNDHTGHTAFRRGSRISARGGRQGNDDLIWDGNERFLTCVNTDFNFSRCLLPYYAWMVSNNHSRDTSVPSFCPWDEGTRAFGAGPSSQGWAPALAPLPPPWIRAWHSPPMAPASPRPIGERFLSLLLWPSQPQSKVIKTHDVREPALMVRGTALPWKVSNIPDLYAKTLKTFYM